MNGFEENDNIVTFSAVCFGEKFRMKWDGTFLSNFEEEPGELPKKNNTLTPFRPSLFLQNQLKG